MPGSLAFNTTRQSASLAADGIRWNKATTAQNTNALDLQNIRNDPAEENRANYKRMHERLRQTQVTKLDSPETSRKYIVARAGCVSQLMHNA